MRELAEKKGLLEDLQVKLKLSSAENLELRDKQTAAERELKSLTCS